MTYLHDDGIILQVLVPQTFHLSKGATEHDETIMKRGLCLHDLHPSILVESEFSRNPKYLESKSLSTSVEKKAPDKYPICSYVHTYRLHCVMKDDDI